MARRGSRVLDYSRWVCRNFSSLTPRPIILSQLCSVKRIIFRFYEKLNEQHCDRSNFAENFHRESDSMFQEEKLKVHWQLICSVFAAIRDSSGIK